MKKSAKRLMAKLRARPSRYYLLLFGLLLVLITGSWLYYSHGVKDLLPKKGVLAEDQLFPTSTEAAYRNLDLRIAASASYVGRSIKKVRDLGVENNVRISVISFRVEHDGLTEFGLMSEPLSPQPPRGYPVLVLLHGYATPKRYLTTQFYLSDMEEYSHSGFVVIKPDLRGQGLSLDIGRPEGAYYSMAYNTDVMSLLADIKKTDHLDDSNINLWGHSMGAYIALRAAVLSPDIKNLILLSGPVGYIKDMYTSYIPISDRNNPVAKSIKEAVLLRYGNPLTEPQFWNTTSPLSYIPWLRAKVQIHVGSDDTVVPPAFSADFDRALSAAHSQHEYYVYSGGDHGLVDDRSLIYQRSLRLLLGTK